MLLIILTVKISTIDTNELKYIKNETILAILLAIKFQFI